jgi:hypothetical protein
MSSASQMMPYKNRSNVIKANYQAPVNKQMSGSSNALLVEPRPQWHASLWTGDIDVQQRAYRRF